MSTFAGALVFARHEARLGARDLAGVLRGGRSNNRLAGGVLLVALTLIHLVAYGMIGNQGEALAGDIAPRVLVIVSLTLLLSTLMLLSQAIESITRVLYGRGDLELILSSPAPARLILALRIALTGFAVAGATLFVAGPFANVMAVTVGARWLAVYPVVIALGLAMTGLALLLTMGLVRLFGPRRTRLAAQIVAAIVGAGFAIGLQIGAISQYGDVSRYALATSDAILALTPGLGSPLWLPARAATGEPFALAVLIAACLVVFAGALALCMPGLARATLAIASLGSLERKLAPARPRDGAVAWRRSAGEALRAKEALLLWRDPWLVSQTLMQILYLVPPAFLLWQNFGDGTGKLMLLVPILVMSAGQLSGSLAWLAVSGEDAPDLVATAPVTQRSLVLAKFVSVLVALGLIVLPFGLALAWLSAEVALVMLAGAFVAALSSFAIQYWFRQQGRRSQFRRRQTASRLATFAEAFSSILWAAAAALAVAGSWFALVPALLALGNLLGARMLSPQAA